MHTCDRTKLEYLEAKLEDNEREREREKQKNMSLASEAYSVCSHAQDRMKLTSNAGEQS